MHVSRFPPWTTQAAVGQAIVLQGADHSEEQIRKLLHAGLASPPGVRSFSWLSPSGVVLVSTWPQAQYRILADRAHIAAVMEGAARSISDLVASRMDGALIVEVANGVRRDGRLHGMVASELDVRDLRQIFPDTPPDGVVYGIVDRQGRAVWRSPEINLLLEQREVAHDGPAGRALRERRPVTVVSFVAKLDGVHRLGAAVPLEPIGWATYSLADYNRVTSSAIQQAWVETGILCLVTLMAIIAALLTARIILTPISALQAAATAMAGGDLSARVPASRTSELDTVGAAFNEMAGRLQDRKEEERRRHLQELERTNQKLQALIAGMGDGFIATDAAGRILVVNAAVSRILGLPTDLIDRGSEEVGLPRPLLESLQQVSCGAAEVLERTFEADGRRFETRASTVVGPTEGVLGAIALVRDITEQERFRRMQEGLAANVSHELRGPLAAISAAAEALRDGMVNPKRAPEYLEAVLREVGRMRRLTSDILDLARLDAGAVTVIMEPVDLDLFLRDVERDWSPRFAGAGVELVIGKSGLWVQADPQRLYQVANNLLENALKFTGRGRSVEVWSGREDRRARLSFRDTGPGIAPEHQPYVWERFYMADPARTRSIRSGTGLGLSIVRQLVMRMGGEVGLESALEVGSTFSVTLAVAELVQKELCESG